MNPAKTLGLITALMLAVTAFAGVSTATATSVVEGCLGTLEISEEQMKCVGTYDGKVKPAGVSAEALKPTFGGTLAESCSKSSLGMELLMGTEAGTEGMVKLSKLSFSGECAPCSTVEVTGLPSSKGTILMPSEAQDDYVLQSGEFGITFSGCPLAMTCKFIAKKPKLNYETSKEFTSNELRAEGILLEKVSGGEFCGTTAKVSGNYVTSVPKQWWLNLT